MNYELAEIVTNAQHSVIQLIKRFPQKFQKKYPQPIVDNKKNVFLQAF
jgi:hypothetical protein